jgi:hypothetical protein
MWLASVYSLLIIAVAFIVKNAHKEFRSYSISASFSASTVSLSDWHFCHDSQAIDLSHKSANFA